MENQGDEIPRTEPATIPAPHLPTSGPTDHLFEKLSACAQMAETQRVQTITAFLLDHHPMLPALAARLGGNDVVFESAIRGSSMSPAIPSGVRLRVRLNTHEHLESGDIVFFLSNDGFMVHRIVHRSRRRSAAGYLLTLGDNCLAPDPPVQKDRMLGTVIAIHTPDGWRSPGPPMIRSSSHSLIRALMTTLTIATLWFSVSAAHRVATIFLKLEHVGRAPVGRFLRRFHLNSSVR